jgi:hypothetical protein
MAKKKDRGRTAWLVERRWIAEHPRREIVAILSGRLGGARVRELVEFLHVTTFYTLQEQLDMEWPRYGRVPYPAKFGQTKEGDPWSGEIICGNDPLLVARLVDDLTVERDDHGVEKPVWKDRPRASSAWMHEKQTAYQGAGHKLEG